MSASSSQSFYSIDSEDYEETRESFDYLGNLRSPVSTDGSGSEAIGSPGSPVSRTSRQHSYASGHPSSASSRYHSTNSDRSSSSARSRTDDDDGRDRSRAGVRKGKGKERGYEINFIESELFDSEVQDCVMLGFIRSLETTDEKDAIGRLERLGIHLSKTKVIILGEHIKLKFGVEINLTWGIVPESSADFTRASQVTATRSSSQRVVTAQPARTNSIKTPAAEDPQPQLSRRGINETQLVRLEQVLAAKIDDFRNSLVKYRPPSPVETNGTWVVTATAQSAFRGGSSRNPPVRTAPAPPRTEAPKPLPVEAVRPPHTRADTARTLLIRPQSPPTGRDTARQITQQSTRESTRTLSDRESWSRSPETNTDRDLRALQYPRTGLVHNTLAGPSAQPPSARTPSPAPLARIEYPSPRRDTQSSSSRTEPDRAIVQWQLPQSRADTVPTPPPEPEIDMSYVPRVCERYRAGWKRFDQKRIMGWYRNGIGRNVLVSYGDPRKPLYEIIPGNEIGSHNLVDLRSTTPLTEKQKVPGAGAWDRDTKVIGVGRSGSTKRPVVWVLTSNNEWISKTLLEKRVGKYSAESYIVRCARELADWYRAEGYRPEADHYLNHILDVFGGYDRYEHDDDDEPDEPDVQPAAQRSPSPPLNQINYYQTQLGQRSGSQGRSNSDLFTNSRSPSSDSPSPPRSRRGESSDRWPSRSPDPFPNPPSYLESQMSQQLNNQRFSALPSSPPHRSSYSWD